MLFDANQIAELEALIMRRMSHDMCGGPQVAKMWSDAGTLVREIEKWLEERGFEAKSK